jgi:hypothetical protein
MQFSDDQSPKRVKVIEEEGSYWVTIGKGRHFYADKATECAESMYELYKKSLDASLKLAEAEHKLHCIILKRELFKSIYSSSKTLYKMTDNPSEMFDNILEKHERQYVSMCLMCIYAELLYETEKKKLRLLKNSIYNAEQALIGTFKACTIGWAGEAYAAKIGEKRLFSQL